MYLCHVLQGLGGLQQFSLDIQFLLAVCASAVSAQSDKHARTVFRRAVASACNSSPPTSGTESADRETHLEQSVFGAPWIGPLILRLLAGDFKNARLAHAARE